MSPNGRKTAFNNLYTAILALATGVVCATAVFVAVKCLSDYGTIFKIVEAAG
ncbi:MAG TPA: hypothetical protein HPP87_02210 [Planctomycetes bacterium]|nr:hypothetical protein [Planctomycetota bacterium]HIJ70161.1 hypothetical protein [Planctomycetota bacterium]